VTARKTKIYNIVTRKTTTTSSLKNQPEPSPGKRKSESLINPEERSGAKLELKQEIPAPQDQFQDPESIQNLDDFEEVAGIDEVIPREAENLMKAFFLESLHLVQSENDKPEPNNGKGKVQQVQYYKTLYSCNLQIFIMS
jgi:hypothetical protein